MKIILVVGARPNFMKMAPILYEIKKYPDRIHPLLVHTGQHYDKNMSDLFFDDLGLPKPDIFLGVGSGSHAQQTAKIMEKFEAVLLENKPDLVLVVGDVNSTLACALTAAKLHIKVAHVEAGLRSFDRRMPEEINRLLTDAISDYLFLTEASAVKNLEKEGVSQDKMFFVGNVMIDSLLQNLDKAKQSTILSQLQLEKQSYALLTLHRAENVDNRSAMQEILDALMEISKKIQLVFPIHPRTKNKLEEFGLLPKNFKITDPLGYWDFLHLMSQAKFVLTDSGGIQEETTILQIPCLTLRENTERPVTAEKGTNTIVGTNKEKILSHALEVLERKKSQTQIPDLWDGHAARRIVEILLNLI